MSCRLASQRAWSTPGWGSCTCKRSHVGVAWHVRTKWESLEFSRDETWSSTSEQCIARSMLGGKRRRTTVPENADAAAAVYCSSVKQRMSSSFVGRMLPVVVQCGLWTFRWHECSMLMHGTGPCAHAHMHCSGAVAAHWRPYFVHCACACSVAVQYSRSSSQSVGHSIATRYTAKRGRASTVARVRS